MRRTFLEGLRIEARSKRKTLPEVVAEWWAEDWQATVKAMAAFQVKHKHIEAEVVHECPTCQQNRMATEAISNRVGELLSDQKEDSPVAGIIPPSIN